VEGDHRLVDVALSRREGLLLDVPDEPALRPVRADPWMAVTPPTIALTSAYLSCAFPAT
jgi:hypothetical protein